MPRSATTTAHHARPRPTTQSLRDCISRIDIKEVPLSQAKVDQSLEFPFHLPNFMTTDWFPTNFTSLADIVEANFAAFTKGITPAMVQDAGRCCTNLCTRAVVKDGDLNFSGTVNTFRAMSAIELFRRRHAKEKLPDMMMVIDHLDWYAPVDWETNRYCADKLLPIFSHTKARIPWPQSEDAQHKNVVSYQRGIITIPEYARALHAQRTRFVCTHFG